MSVKQITILNSVAMKEHDCLPIMPMCQMHKLIISLTYKLGNTVHSLFRCEAQRRLHTDMTFTKTINTKFF